MTKEELGRLIQESGDSMYRVAKTLLYNDADCADAIQETIAKAFSKLNTLKEPEYAKTWLTRILINECYMTMRREKKLISLDSIKDESQLHNTDYSELYMALNELPSNLKIAITLYYMEGYSVREIAEMEDTTESAVKNRLFKAREKLRNSLSYEKEAAGI